MVASQKGAELLRKAAVARGSGSNSRVIDGQVNECGLTEYWLNPEKTLPETWISVKQPALHVADRMGGPMMDHLTYG